MSASLPPLPAARTAGYDGSARNFRRLVAEAKRGWRREHHRGRRPAVWLPGETLLIDWGTLAGVHVFCAVLAWSRLRFVRFADDEKASTTVELLAECFEVLGGVPQVVLADRMGCLKAGVVANVVVPTPDYVRFATHYGFRPDFCDARGPGVEGDGGEPGRLRQAGPDGAGSSRSTDLWTGNDAAAGVVRRGQRRGALGDRAVPADRLSAERELLRPLPSLRPEIGRQAGRPRKVDKLSCIRFGSARYSVPSRLIGTRSPITTADRG